MPLHYRKMQSPAYSQEYNLFDFIILKKEFQYGNKGIIFLQSKTQN